MADTFGPVCDANDADDIAGAGDRPGQWFP